jgi:hypothetical protein
MEWHSSPSFQPVVDIEVIYLPQQWLMPYPCGLHWSSPSLMPLGYMPVGKETLPHANTSRPDAVQCRWHWAAVELESNLGVSIVPCIACKPHGLDNGPWGDASSHCELERLNSCATSAERPAQLLHTEVALVSAVGDLESLRASLELYSPRALLLLLYPQVAFNRQLHRSMMPTGFTAIIKVGSTLHWEPGQHCHLDNSILPCTSFELSHGVG